MGVSRWFRSGKGRDGVDPVVRSDELRLSYARSSDPRELEESIEWARKGLDHYHDTELTFRAACQSALCMLYRLRWERRRSRSDLDAAVTHGQQALELSPDGDPNLGRHMSSLATALQETFDHGGELTVIDEAIGLHRSLLDIVDPAAEEYAGTVSNLANSLMRRAGREPDPAVADEAIRCARTALDATPAGAPAHRVRLVNLGAALTELAPINVSARGITATRSMLGEAESVTERALAEFPPSHPICAGLQQTLRTIREMRRTLGG